MKKKGKIFLLLITIVILIVMIYLVLSSKSRVEIGKEPIEKITVLEKNDDKKEVQKKEESEYEKIIETAIQKGNIKSAYLLLKSYKKNYPESSIKQNNYKIKIDKLEEEALKNYKNALTRTHEKIDEVQDSKFRMANIQSENTPKSLVVPYIGYNGDQPYIRFRISFYSKEGWLFFNKATFKVDEELFEYEFDYKDINRQVIYANEVIEILDIKPNVEQLDMLRKIIKSNKTILRLQGDNHIEDRTIGDKEKQAIKDILTIYDYEYNPYILY